MSNVKGHIKLYVGLGTHVSVIFYTYIRGCAYTF